MRLSPVLLAVVAITIPLGGSLSANAETANSSKQTTEVLTLETNQQPEKDTNQVESSKSLESQPHLTGVTEAEKSRIIAVYPANPAAMPAVVTERSRSAGDTYATPEVIVPTSTTSTTAQTPPIDPNPTQQPSPTPDIPPPEIQQTTPSPTPEATPLPENVTPPVTEPVVPTIPGDTQQPSPTLDIPLPGSQERTPAPSPGTPGDTQQPSPAPDTPFPDSQQRTPAPAPGTTPENTQPNTAPEANDPRVLVSEVVIRSQTGQLPPELEDQVYRVIRTQPGQTTTRSLQSNSYPTRTNNNPQPTARRY